MEIRPPKDNFHVPCATQAQTKESSLISLNEGLW